MRFSDIDPDQAIIKEFIPFCAKQMGMSDLPEIMISDNPEFSMAIKAFANYNLETDVIRVNTHGRQIMDTLRTLAHEMVHAAQNRGLVQADLESDLPGQGIEHVANSLAGVIMRRWAKVHPELFSRSQ
jgi:Zn-dependent peptidase ImmA (M78 family)